MSSPLSIAGIRSHSIGMINAKRVVEKVVGDTLDYGMLSVRSVNKTLQDASSRQNLQNLYFGVGFTILRFGSLFRKYAEDAISRSVEDGISRALKKFNTIRVKSEVVSSQYYTSYTRNEVGSKEMSTIPLVKCSECARSMSCPLPSKDPDFRLCFTPIKEEELWK